MLLGFVAPGLKAGVDTGLILSAGAQAVEDLRAGGGSAGAVRRAGGARLPHDGIAVPISTGHGACSAVGRTGFAGLCLIARGISATYEAVVWAVARGLIRLTDVVPTLRAVDWASGVVFVSIADPVATGPRANRLVTRCEKGSAVGDGAGVAPFGAGICTFGAAVFVDTSQNEHRVFLGLQAPVLVTDLRAVHVGALVDAGEKVLAVALSTGAVVGAVATGLPFHRLTYPISTAHCAVVWAGGGVFSVFADAVATFDVETPGGIQETVAGAGQLSSGESCVGTGLPPQIRGVALFVAFDEAVPTYGALAAVFGTGLTILCRTVALSVPALCTVFRAVGWGFIFFTYFVAAVAVLWAGGAVFVSIADPVPTHEGAGSAGVVVAAGGSKGRPCH